MLLASEPAAWAAERGDLAELRRLVEAVPCKVKSLAGCLATACQNGRAKCAQYLVDLPPPAAPDRAIDVAKYAYHELPCLRILHEAGFAITECTLRKAAYHGELATLKYAREQNVTFTPTVVKKAADGGKLECLQFLQAIVSDPRPDTLVGAIVGGNFACVKFLVESRYGCSDLGGLAYIGYPKAVQKLLQDHNLATE